MKTKTLLFSVILDPNNLHDSVDYITKTINDLKISGRKINDADYVQISDPQNTGGTKIVLHFYEDID